MPKRRFIHFGRAHAYGRRHPRLPQYAAIGEPSYFTPVGLTQRTRQATPWVEELKLH
jgi:hypothetical protein